MPDYRKGTHTVYDIQYHFVWVTKYRYQGPAGMVSRKGTLSLSDSVNIEIPLVPDTTN